MNTPAKPRAESLEYPRDALDAMLREVGIRGAAHIPTMVALRFGLDEIPPTLARLSEALDTAGVTCRLSFVAETADGRELERFDVVIR